MNAEESAPSPAPGSEGERERDPARPLLPPLPLGVTIPRHIRTAPGKVVTISVLHAIALWWRECGKVREVARITGLTVTTVRRYVREGDAARGIPPLDQIAPEDLPPFPVKWKRGGGTIPLGQHGGDAIPEPLEEPEAPPVAQVLGLPAPLAPAHPPQSSAEAPSAPSAPPQATRAPVAPLPPPAEAPEAPALRAGLAVPSHHDGFTPQPGVDVGHTLGVANAEMVRVSRNTRGLFNAKQRALAAMVRKLQRDGGDGTSRLSKTDKDLLMVLREVRLNAQDVDRLYARERDILGVGQGAGVSAPSSTDESEPSPDALTMPQARRLGGESIEDLAAEVRALLAENPNLAPDDPNAQTASPLGGMPVTVQGSVFDHMKGDKQPGVTR